MKRTKAFTLIEVVLALAVLVFGLYGVLDLFFHSHRTANRSHLQTQAFFVAQQRVEELKSVGYDALRSYLTQPSVSPSEPILYPEEWEPADAKKSLYWRVQLREVTEQPDCVEIQASVRHAVAEGELIRVVDYAWKR